MSYSEESKCLSNTSTPCASFDSEDFDRYDLFLESIENNFDCEDFEYLESEEGNLPNSSTEKTNKYSIETINQLISNNNQYINTLLQYPGMTPARLAILLNYKDNIQSYYKIPKKKRPRRIPTEQDRIKRNLSRRVNFYPRIIKRDIRRDYMNMHFNVLNSGDKVLFHQYLTKYCDPNCILVKSIFNSSNPLPKSKYQSQGIHKLLEYYHLMCESSPDFIFTLNHVRICSHPTNQKSILLASFHASGTKIKFFQQGLLSIVQQLQTYSQSFFQSFLSSSSSTSGCNNNQTNTSYDQKQAISTVSEEEFFYEETEQHIPIKELTRDSFYLLLIERFDPITVQLSQQIAHMLYDLTPQKIYQLMKHSLEEKNPMLLFTPLFPGIKANGDCIFKMYLNEQNQISKLDYSLCNLQLEVSSGILLR